MDPVEEKRLLKKKNLTLKEAADVMGVHPNFLYTRIGKPNGPPYRKRGRVYRIPAWDFLKWERAETA